MILRAACSSAFLALHDAVLDLQRGRVDYAVVGGSSAIFRPATSLAFLRLKWVSLPPSCQHRITNRTAAVPLARQAGSPSQHNF